MKSDSPHSDDQIKRIELPGGQTMDVLSLSDATEEATRAVEKTRDLHLCEQCSSELVYPIDWAQDGTRWRVTLRCPECEQMSSDSFDQETVDVFDERLEEGTQDLLRTLQELAAANMSEYVEKFVGALEADAILPEDFSS